jgi:hypothetical protein
MSTPPQGFFAQSAVPSTLTGETIDAELNTIKNDFHGYDYVLYPSGGNYNARKISTGVLTTNSDFVTLLNNAITDMNASGGKFLFLQGKYIINGNILIPKYTYTATYPFVFEGAVYPALRNQGGVYFEIGPSFTNNSYIFQSISAGGSSTTSIFEIRNIFAGNIHYGANADGTHNLDGNTSPIINAGFCHFESDLSAGFRAPCVIENIVFQYLWRGIHLTGYMFWPIIRNIATDDISTSFQGDTWILLDLGSGHGDKVKMLTLENIRFGTNSTGGMSGNMNNAIVLSGGYHKVRNVFIDGARYNNSVIALKQCFNSTLYDIYTIDLVTGADIPGSFIGVYSLDSTSPEGVVGNSTYWCYNNQIYGSSGSPSTSFSFAFRNGAFRNYIRTYDYHGSIIKVDDAAAGMDNIIELIPGANASITAGDAKATTTNNIVTLRDLRQGIDKPLFTTPSAGRFIGYRGPTSSSTSANLGVGMLNGVAAANGTGATSANGPTTTDGWRVNWATGTNNTFARAGWWQANAAAGTVVRYTNPTFTVRFRLGAAQTASNAMLYIGFINVTAQPTAGTSMLATLLNTNIGVLFGFRPADTTWMIMSNNAQATAVYTSLTGLPNAGATDATAHTLSISLNDTIPNINWSFDGVIQTPITDTTNSVPPQLTTLYPMMMLEAQSATSLTLFEHWSQLSVDSS